MGLRKTHKKRKSSKRKSIHRRKSKGTRRYRKRNKTYKNKNIRRYTKKGGADQACQLKCGKCTLGCIKGLIEENKHLEKVVKLVDNFATIAGRPMKKRLRTFHYMTIGGVREAVKVIIPKIDKLNNLEKKKDKINAHIDIQKTINNTFKNPSNFNIPDNEKELKDDITYFNKISDKEIEKIVESEDYVKNIDGMFLPGDSETIEQQTTEQFLHSLQENRGDELNYPEIENFVDGNSF
jgi:hypothetical protein